MTQEQNASHEVQTNLSAPNADGNIKLIGEALEQATHIDDEALDEYQVDLGADYPEPRYTLKFGGVGTLPRGDIQAIKAKSKNGKSFLCSILAASILGCKDFDFETQEEKQNVLYFDCEQNKRNTVRLAKRVHTLLKWNASVNNSRFRAYCLREMDLSQRWSFILKMTNARRPAMIVVDGIADLIGNFNDIDESTRIIDSLMKLSSSCDCSVICVLHTNKAKDDANMKGHLGTLLLQKASDVLSVSKKDLIFSVSETDCRNVPISDFAFTIDRDGIPVATATLKESQQQEKEGKEREELDVALDKVFCDMDELGYNELAKRYCSEMGESEATAKRRIKRAMELDLLEQLPNKKYRRKGQRYHGITPSIKGCDTLIPFSDPEVSSQENDTPVILDTDEEVAPF